MNALVVYNLILVFVGVSAYIAEYGMSKTQRLLGRLCCFLSLFVPAALRYDIGTDYSFYVDAFNSLDTALEYEYGFRTLIFILRKIGCSSQGLFVLTSALIYLPLCSLLRRKDFSIKIILYFLLFYLYSYNVIRNAIAITFVILSVEYFTEARYLKSIIWCIVAYLFHYSSLILLPLYISFFICKNKYFFTVSYIFILYTAITSKLFLVLNHPLFLDSRYGIYVGSSHSNEAIIGSGFGILLYMSVPIAVMILLYKISFKNNRLYIIGLSLYIACYILSLKVEIFGRLTDIFSIFIILSIPRIRNIFIIRRIGGRITKIALCAILFLLFQIQILNNKVNNLSGGHGINPYQTIISKDYN